jgi:hypothetical protein
MDNGNVLALTMETKTWTITDKPFLGQLSLINRTLAVNIWPDITIQEMTLELHIRKCNRALLILALALEV